MDFNDLVEDLVDKVPSWNKIVRYPVGQVPSWTRTAQHCPDTKPPLKLYDSTTTYYYVICNHICLHGLCTEPLEKKTYDSTTTYYYDIC